MNKKIHKAIIVRSRPRNNFLKEKKPFSREGNNEKFSDL